MRWLAVLLMLSCAASAGAREPRATAAAVARAIEQHYYDADRGARIAADLREAAARGEFDAHTAPLDLATALDAKLDPLDRHFSVRWSPPSADATPGRTRRGGPPPPGEHGIRGVRILPGNLGQLDLAFFADFDFARPEAPPRVAIDAALALLQ